MKLKLFAFTFLTFCLAAIAGAPAAQAVSLTTVADGLNNAQGLTFGPDGTLYVAETGLGGDGRCQGSPSTGGQPICAGNTSEVTVISPSGEISQKFEGFDSLALQPSQYQGAGIQELGFDSNGGAYFLSGYAGNPGNRDVELNAAAANVEFPPLQNVIAPLVPPDQTLNVPSLAKLYKADLATEQYTEIADLGRYEVFNNPDGGDVISNPYALAIKGDAAYISDGGGNTIYKVGINGNDEFKAIPVPTQIVNSPEYPPISPDLPPGVIPEGGIPEEVELQSVPTGITVGPDGGIYFSEYTGFPYPNGEARVFRLNENDEIEVFADGFSHVTDVAFDKDGNLLVLQFSDEPEWKGLDLASLPGSLVQVTPDGTRTTLIAAGEGLRSATGITVSPEGDIYITDRGVGPQNGSVLKVERSEAVPEPTSALGMLAFAALGGSAWLKRKQQQLAE